MLSAVIVTYNSSAHIGRCLASLESKVSEIVVVDNASSDGTSEIVRTQYPAVKLISSETNLGFAGAANLGARHAEEDVFLFFNPDAVCLDPLRPLENALRSNANLAAAAGRLVNHNEQTQTGFTVRRLPTAASLLFEILLLNRLFPRNPVNRAYRCFDLSLDRPQEVEQPAGACLAVRRDCFEACGGFDESFFPLWFEDADLCKRLHDQGKAILFLPEVRVEHHGGHSLDSITFSQKQIYWYRNMLYYVRKHFPWRTGLAIRAALLLGMGLRMAAETVVVSPVSRTPAPPFKERLQAYWKAAMLSFGGDGGAVGNGAIPPRVRRSTERGWLDQK